MASVKKYTRTVANKILRHNSRLNKTYSNPDINPEMTKYNVKLFDKGYAGYKKRLQELHVSKRKDVNTLCEWVVTMPETAYASTSTAYNFNDYRDGERSLNDSNTLYVAADIAAFLCNRYGDDNCIQAIIHVDESGSSHLHFTFIPVVEDLKHGGQKVCAKNVINRKDLQTFHPDLRDYLNQQQLEGGLTLKPSRASGVVNKENLVWRTKMVNLGKWKVGSQIMIGDLFYTGITKAQGGNRTVAEMKHEREQQRNIEYSMDVEHVI